MFLFILGINKDVIYKYQDKPIQIPTEYVFHHTHKVCGCIGQTKWHQYKLVAAIPHTKGHFINVLIVDMYLIVSRSQVNIQKDLGSSYFIEQVIDPREWVSVLDGHLVKLAVIDAHTHHTGLLL